jgi:hypothetical protein
MHRPGAAGVANPAVPGGHPSTPGSSGPEGVTGGLKARTTIAASGAALNTSRVCDPPVPEVRSSPATAGPPRRSVVRR